MNEAFDDVGGDGTLELEPVTASEIDYDRGGRALVRIMQLGDARVVYVSVAPSAEGAQFGERADPDRGGERRMNVYDRSSDVDGSGEIRVGRSDQRAACADVTIVSRDGHATIALSPQDARRMGEALIELAKANGA